MSRGTEESNRGEESCCGGGGGGGGVEGKGRGEEQEGKPPRVSVRVARKV